MGRVTDLVTKRRRRGDRRCRHAEGAGAWRAGFLHGMRAGLVRSHRQVPALCAAYNRSAPPVPLPDFLGALSVLLAKDVLRNDGVC